ncbi:MAG: hypothetical protein A2X67_14100 [Ignavibacteria bacterium GWA2_55_11]|nr:MAG: hypothetical protein A2X67_14100 [Ignavibacteria bacterium GWA2_55_11]OGU45237.1 MAG: hypothetical protein A2X68_04880 [Ignavibacteria bacterium GWC2_56_12]OGU72725.1 MAG: hypothetical protein A3H45_09230 [Ignavibacteria bacterium RIFCSPLOWO2_02_FULL_55_14]
MKKQNQSPVFTSEIKEFLKANPRIKESLDLFEISEEQYVKAMRSMEPEISTTNEITVQECDP